MNKVLISMFIFVLLLAGYFGLGYFSYKYKILLCQKTVYDPYIQPDADPALKIGTIPYYYYYNCLILPGMGSLYGKFGPYYQNDANGQFVERP